MTGSADPEKVSGSTLKEMMCVALTGETPVVFVKDSKKPRVEIRLLQAAGDVFSLCWIVSICLNISWR